MNTLSYKRNNKAYFDSLVNGDIFVLNDKVYMKVGDEILSQDKKKIMTLYYGDNNNHDFCVNLETGEAMEIAGGTLVEPLWEVKIKKDDNWYIN